MRHKVAAVLIVLGSFWALTAWPRLLYSLSDEATGNVYWDEIHAAMARPDSALAVLKKIENPALLSVVFDAEWVVHHGKQPTFSQAIGRNFLFNAISHIGPFVVLHPEDAPSLHALVDDLSSAMKIKKPMVIYSETSLFNAFAAGLSRDNSCIFLCRGMLEKIPASAVLGVVAHELGHIMHNHTKKKFVATCVAGAAMAGLFMQSAYAACKADKKGPAILRGTAHCFALGLLCMGLEILYTRRCERQADQAMRTYIKDRGFAMLESILHYEKSGGQAEAVVITDLMKMRRFEGLTGEQRLEFQERAAQGQQWVHAHHHNCRGLNALFSTHPGTQERLATILLEE